MMSSGVDNAMCILRAVVRAYPQATVQEVRMRTSRSEAWARDALDVLCHAGLIEQYKDNREGDRRVVLHWRPTLKGTEALEASCTALAQTVAMWQRMLDGELQVMWLAQQYTRGPEDVG